MKRVAEAAPVARSRSRFGGRDLQTHCFYATGTIYGSRAKRPHLTLTASTTCAAVIDLSTALGPSGHYTNQAYYQSMLGGQPMTAAQQAYADQEDQLRLLGFLSEFGGDFALGQIFYHIAYGITPPPPPSAVDLASAGSDLPPPSITPSGLVAGASDVGDTGSVFTGVGYNGAGLSLTAIVVPEASTWAMMLLGFAGLGFAGYRASRRACSHVRRSSPHAPLNLRQTDDHVAVAFVWARLAT
jgi:hypothetical protein